MMALHCTANIFLGYCEFICLQQENTINALNVIAVYFWLLLKAYKFVVFVNGERKW